MGFEPIPSSKLTGQSTGTSGRRKGAGRRRAAEKGGEAKAGGKRRVVGGTSSRRLDRRCFGTGPGSKAAGGQWGGAGKCQIGPEGAASGLGKGGVMDKDGKGGEGGDRRAVEGRRSNGIRGGARRPKQITATNTARACQIRERIAGTFKRFICQGNAGGRFPFGAGREGRWRVAVTQQARTRMLRDH
ncbi:hypothetical protein B0H14DRAFT_2563350 [Mycena olivaceomarginata]|nr:hypothetical protein B0H14DRAFT_2563350 [Mycena olivaceomarginata]